MISFNLTRKPWIPVEGLDGTVAEVSTRDVLSHAHCLRALADASPLVVAALTRHLLAVLHRSYDGPRSMGEWREIASSEAFDSVRISAYLDSVEDRMDLFHPAVPFAQTRGLLEQFSKYVTPIDEIEIFRASWGGGRELFRHRPASPPLCMSPARAARALLAHHAFARGGLVKKPGEPVSAAAAPLTWAAVVIVRGHTLFQTLVANLLKYGPDVPIPTGGAPDACSWEQDPLPLQVRGRNEPKRAPLGYLDLLTWLSRRVELVTDGSAVTGFVNAVGQGLAKNATSDPMVAYRGHEKRGWLAINIDAERAFWRDAAALFETSRGEKAAFQRPGAIDLIATDEAGEILGDSMYDIEVLGADVDKKKITVVHAVRFERVQARGRCFNDSHAGEAVREALAFAQHAVDALNSGLALYARAALSPGDRQPDAATVRSLTNSFGAKSAAWSAMGVAFEHFLRQLANDPSVALETFRLTAANIVSDIFRSTTARGDADGRWLKARALAEMSFGARLHTALSSATR